LRKIAEGSETETDKVPNLSSSRTRRDIFWREREIERERECVCVSVRECVCVSERERERETQ
jgi:hypothetical protein